MKRNLYTIFLSILMVLPFGLLSQTHYADWVKTIENAAENSSFNNVVFDGQNYILNGYYTGQANYGNFVFPGGLSPNGVVIKVNDAGEPIWVTTIDGSGLEMFYDLVIDSEKNIILTGWTSTYDTLYVNGVPVFEAGGEYTNRCITAKLSGVDGSLMWFKYITALEYAAINSTKLTLDEDDNIYISGYYSCPFEVDGIQLPYTKFYGDDLFILKLTPEGTAVWGQHIPAIEDGGYATIRSIKANEDGLYFSMEYYKPYIVNGTALPYSGDYYWLAVAKASLQSGVIENIYAFGTPGGQLIQEIELDQAGNILVVGFFSADFPLTIGDVTLQGKGYNDGFLFKMNHELQVLWAKPMGGEYTDIAFNVQVGDNDQIFIGGGFDCYSDFYFNNEVVLNAQMPNSLSNFYVVTDGDGNFIQSAGMYGHWQETILSFNSAVTKVNDGQLEVYSAGYFYDSVYFVQGQPSFGFHNTGYFYKWQLPYVTGTSAGEHPRADFAVYPNPVTDYLWVNPAGTAVKAEIINVDGKVVETFEVFEAASFPVGHLANGSYLVRLTAPNLTQSFRVIKK